jgi:hypothetical protein
MAIIPGNLLRKIIGTVILASAMLSPWIANAENRGYFCADPRTWSPYLPPASTCKTGWQGYLTEPPPDRHGNDPMSCAQWNVAPQQETPLQPIACVTIYVKTPSQAARSISGRAPQEAFDLSNADAEVQSFILNINALIEKYNKGWRPSVADIANHEKNGYVGSSLFVALHVPENPIDTDRQAINNAFLDDAAQALRFMDSTTSAAQTTAAERKGQRPYFLVALAILNDEGRRKTVPGLTPLARIRPPFAREGCEAEATRAAKERLLAPTNPYITARYECWTEAKFMQVTAALARCSQFGVGCDKLPL